MKSLLSYHPDDMEPSGIKTGFLHLLSVYTDIDFTIEDTIELITENVYRNHRKAGSYISINIILLLLVFFSQLFR